MSETEAKLSSQNENRPIHSQRGWRQKNSSAYLTPLSSYVMQTTFIFFCLGHSTKIKHFGQLDKAIHSSEFHTLTFQSGYLQSKSLYK